MILVGNQRGGSNALAAHLLSSQNDHVDVHALENFVADDLTGALKEIHAVSKATQCKKFMFSLSLNPPEEANPTVEDYEDAIARVENKLGLQNQAKAIVFHSKGDRPMHAHCVWSRIDTEKMKAVKLDFYKRKLNTVAKELYIEHNWTMPDGFKNGLSRDLRTYNLDEWQQGERHKLNAAQTKARIQYCWKQSDNAESFKAALEHEGFFLAKGDRKNIHLAVDWHGEFYAITRATGENAKAVKAKLGQPDTLPTLNTTKALIKREYSTLHERLRSELTNKHRTQLQPLQTQKDDVLKNQRAARQKQKEDHAKRQLKEQQARQEQYQRGLKGLWRYITGRYHKQKQEHEVQYQTGLQRDAKEKKALIDKQLKELKPVYKEIKQLKNTHQQQTMQLNKDFMTLYKNKGESHTLKDKFSKTSPVKSDVLNNQSELKP
jgi:hypothetical protein